VSLGMASEHLLNVQEAFAGDDVVEAFEREKEEEVEKGRPKEVEPTLPGNTLSVELRCCIYRNMWHTGTQVLSFSSKVLKNGEGVWKI